MFVKKHIGDSARRQLKLFKLSGGDSCDHMPDVRDASLEELPAMDEIVSHPGKDLDGEWDSDAES
jgi:hypothetical protein